MIEITTCDHKKQMYNYIRIESFDILSILKEHDDNKTCEFVEVELSWGVTKFKNLEVLTELKNLNIIYLTNTLKLSCSFLKIFLKSSAQLLFIYDEFSALSVLINS